MKNFLNFLSHHAFQAFFFLVSLAGTIIALHTFGLPITFNIIGILTVFILFLFANLIRLVNRKIEEPLDVLLFHFILPTDGIKPFYNLILDSAAKSLERLSDRNWLLVPRIPDSSFDRLDIWQKYDGVAALKRITGGILLLADDPDENFDKIIESVSSTEIPVVMVDVYFDLTKYDARNQSKMPQFVGGDEVAGGRIAAEMLTGQISQKCADMDDSPTILIIKGGNTAWELQRIESFKETLEKELGCAYLETDCLFYNREEAFNVVHRLFSDMSPKQLAQCSGVFAANDDMAIGARNAIRDLVKNRGKEINVSIVGYDGAPEMKKLIQRGDDYLIGTVDVKIREQGEAAIYVMKQLVEGKLPKQRVTLITPTKYTRV